MVFKKKKIAFSITANEGGGATAKVNPNARQYTRITPTGKGTFHIWSTPKKKGKGKVLIKDKNGNRIAVGG
ncbi:MAG: hypothetical protein ABH854_04990 [Candidatus Diapherotrites archaeon]|nr:hypothetical protein [Candidatus Micrarchaeota archaeon]MBU1939828.1 hypothetical protein [Candidatus Micrarchaeota archaeon]